VLAARLDISVNIKVVGKSLTRSQLKALWTRKRMVKMVKMAGLNGVGAEALAKEPFCDRHTNWRQFWGHTERNNDPT